MLGRSNRSFQEWTHDQFRALLEAAPDATVIADQHGKIILVNAQTEKIFGYKRNELLSHPVEMLIPARCRALHVHHRQDYSGTPRVHPMGAGRELYGLRKDGSEFPVEISLSPFRTDAGDLVFSAIGDITSQKTVQNELREAKEKLETRVQERTAELVMANEALQAEIVQRELAMRQRDNEQKCAMSRLSRSPLPTTLSAGKSARCWTSPLKSQKLAGRSGPGPSGEVMKITLLCAI